MVASAWIAAEPDQPGRPISPPIARLRSRIHAEIAAPQAAMTRALAMTIVRRGVAVASSPRTVRSANSRPKTHAVRNANRIDSADGDGLPEERPVGRPVSGPGGQLCLGPEQAQRPGRLRVLEDHHEQAHDQGCDREPDGDAPGHAGAAALQELGRDCRAEARHAAPASSLVRRMKCSSSDSRAIARCDGGAPADDEDLGDPLRRLEGHRVAEFESPLASPLRRQAGRQQCGLGRLEIAGLDFEASVAALLQGVAVEFLDQPAPMDDADPVREQVDLAEDVAGHEDRHALVLCQVAEQVADLDDAGGIEAVGRLVEDQKFGTMQQGAGEGQPLEVAERQRAGPPAGVGTERQPVDHQVHPPAVLDAGQSPGNVEVLDDRQFRVGGGGLDQVTDAAPQVGRPGRDPNPEQVGVPSGRLDHPEQHPDRRGLSGAVEAEEGVDLAASDP